MSSGGSRPTRGGGRNTRLALPELKKKLNLTIIGPTRTLKIQGVDHKKQDFWSEQGRNGQTGSPGPHRVIRLLEPGQNFQNRIKINKNLTFTRFFDSELG